MLIIIELSEGEHGLQGTICVSACLKISVIKMILNCDGDYTKLLIYHKLFVGRDPFPFNLQF